MPCRFYHLGPRLREQAYIYCCTRYISGILSTVAKLPLFPVARFAFRTFLYSKMHYTRTRLAQNRPISLPLLKKVKIMILV